MALINFLSLWLSLLQVVALTASVDAAKDEMVLAVRVARDEQAAADQARIAEVIEGVRAG